MENVTYVICARIDSPERLANLDFNIHYLQTNFPECKIIIMEEDAASKISGRYNNIQHVFIRSLFPIFQRTRLVNKAVNEFLKTGYFCLYDMDIFVDPDIHRKAVEYLKDYSVVYPFDGKFFEIPQTYNKIKDLKTSDIHNSDKMMINVDSVGGAIYFRVTDFIKGGMENEFFLGWGHEDGERYIRFSKLGYRIKRMDNPMYHFTHPRNINSSGKNPHVFKNEAEKIKVMNMAKHELINYINNEFHWCKMRKIIKISIVIPTYEMVGHGVDFLKYNIGKILEQTFTDFEIIVSDHSIGDEIKDILTIYKDDRIVYLKNINNRGNAPANLNFGIMHASGEIIKPMFQDDYFCNHTALSLIHNVFLSGYTWAAMGSNQSKDRKKYYLENIPYYNANIIHGINTISSPSCIAYLKDNEIIWDESLAWLFDCKFYYDLHRKFGDPYIIKDILVTNFIHKDQCSNLLTEERKQLEVSRMKNEYQL
jgi:hypothetical protein